MIKTIALRLKNQPKIILALSLIFLVCCLTIPQKVLAATSADKVCTKDLIALSGVKSPTDKDVTACKTGFNAAKNNKSIKQACGSLKGTQNTACEGGHKLGSIKSDSGDILEGSTTFTAQKGAENFCSQGSDDEKSACRNGYRHGYMGDESESRACENREPFYNAKEEAACKKGYKQGKLDKPPDAPLEGGVGKKGNYVCGTYSDEDRNVKTVFDFGCLGTAYAKDPSKFPDSSKNLSPIQDMAFALIRFLSTGVGIVITLALIASGIQYAGSEGNAEASAKAKKRAQDALVGLVIYMFAWAILQFLIPGGVFK